MSTLYVDTINEKTSGNGVQIPGHVVQVVSAAYNTTVTLSTTSSAVETGLAATITPKSNTSKILVLVNQNIQVSGSGYARIVLRKGTIASSTIMAIMSSPEGYTNSADESINTIPMCYEDSPATTSATRYFCSMELLAGTTMYAQTSTGGFSVSTITLMEIAQ
jgi:hypothetical protein